MGDRWALSVPKPGFVGLSPEWPVGITHLRDNGIDHSAVILALCYLPYML